MYQVYHLATVEQKLEREKQHFCICAASSAQHQRQKDSFSSILLLLKNTKIAGAKKRSSVGMY